jgi:hypothetical protein
MASQLKHAGRLKVKLSSEILQTKIRPYFTYDNFSPTVIEFGLVKLFGMKTIRAEIAKQASRTSIA